MVNFSRVFSVRFIQYGLISNSWSPAHLPCVYTVCSFVLFWGEPKGLCEIKSTWSSGDNSLLWLLATRDTSRTAACYPSRLLSSVSPTHPPAIPWDIQQRLAAHGTEERRYCEGLLCSGWIWFKAGHVDRLRTFKDRNIRKSETLDTNIKLFIDSATLKEKWNIQSEELFSPSTEILSLES